MKNYGNIVKKYVLKEKSSKYKPIVVDNIFDYQRAQLADLERFLKKDFQTRENRDNPVAHARNLENQKKEIRCEIARLRGQIGRAPKEKKGS